MGRRRLDPGNDRHRRRRDRAVLAALLALVLGVFASCDGDGSPTATSGDDAPTTRAGERPSSSPAPSSPTSASTSPSTSTPATGPVADRCAPFAAQVFAAAQTELDRLATVPLSALRTEQQSAELTDDYYTRVDDAEAGAAAAGCDRVALARTVLTGTEGLRTSGPVAVATKSGIVDEMAWRIARTLAKPLDAPLLVVPVPGRFAVDAAALRTCQAVGAAYLPLEQALIDALAGVALDDYLARPNLRSLDLRDAVSPDPVGGLQFVNTTLDDALTVLSDRADALQCSETVVSGVLVEQGDQLRATSPTGIVFKADQIDLALLLVTTG